MLAQLVRESLILGTDILTVDAELFQQILTPDISEEAQYHDRLQRATDNAIGYVVTPAGRGTTVWILVLEDGRFWRWGGFSGEYYETYIEEHKWLADLPQLFLVGEQPTSIEGKLADIEGKLANAEDAVAAAIARVEDAIADDAR